MKPAQSPLAQNDDDLLADGRAGNEMAFFELYRRHEGAVFRFALHMCGRRDIAEEVLQEVFLALLTPKCGYSPERGTLEAFLVGAARNQVRRHLREVARNNSTDIEICSHPAAEYAGRDEELQALRRAIVSLPERYRAVTVLCDLEERSYAETAAHLGISVGTVRSRLHRARSILQNKLRRRYGCPV